MLNSIAFAKSSSSFNSSSSNCTYDNITATIISSTFTLSSDCLQPHCSPDCVQVNHCEKIYPIAVQPKINGHPKKVAVISNSSSHQLCLPDVMNGKPIKADSLKSHLHQLICLKQQLTSCKQ